MCKCKCKCEEISELEKYNKKSMSEKKLQKLEEIADNTKNTEINTGMLFFTAFTYFVVKIIILLVG